MAQCEVCGNEYDKAFQISMPGEGTRTFDSFECAIHALAPPCEHCGVKVIGHGEGRAPLRYGRGSGGRTEGVVG